jgi:hypothetical protein
MSFTHACGHKPLAGYTIKRGISTGGFGEVYFGLTDGGKEVALKRIIRHQDIELRGIRQCLNLKHPYLVHLYDLKVDDRGEPWLVMEYVRGETLQSILRKHPQGLPADLVRPWFDQLAAAIHSLHEQGIVHRDLKPANVFIENGTVKVGDYGLCKFIGASQHRSQTQNVGTVHYMAPEIGRGDYSRSIDIYAAGILLYEMVTGRIPFDGETTGEILFKHLSSAPDLSRTGAFAPIIAKALAKAPGERFGSLAEMARRVTETDSVAAPSTPTLTQSATQIPGASTASTVVMVKIPRDENLSSRLAISGFTVAALSLAAAGIFFEGDWRRMTPAFVLAVLASWSVILVSRRWTEDREDSLGRRLLFGLLGIGIGLAAVWLEGYSFALAAAGASRNTDAGARSPFFGALYPKPSSLPVLFGYVAYFGLMFSIVRWWHMTAPTRPTRLAWPGALAVGFLAYVLLFLLPTGDERLVGFATATLASIAVQLGSPRRDPDPAPSKRLRLKWA